MRTSAVNYLIAYCCLHCTSSGPAYNRPLSWNSALARANQLSLSSSLSPPSSFPIEFFIRTLYSCDCNFPPRSISRVSFVSLFSRDIASTTPDVDENHPARSLAINLSFTIPRSSCSLAYLRCLALAPIRRHVDARAIDVSHEIRDRFRYDLSANILSAISD